MVSSDFKLVHKINVRGINLAYRVKPSSEGQKTKGVVFLLHGLMDHSGTWNEIIDLLDPGYIYVALDFRGHGDSDWIPAGFSDYFYMDCIIDTVLFIKQISEEIRTAFNATKTTFGEIVTKKYFGGKFSGATFQLQRPLRKFIFGHSLGGNFAAWAVSEQRYEKIDGIIILEGSQMIGQTSERIVQSDGNSYDWVMNRNLSTLGNKKMYASREEAVKRFSEAHVSFNPAVARKIANENVKKVGQLYAFKFDPRMSFRKTRNSIPRALAEVLWQRVQDPVLILTASKGLVGKYLWAEHEAFLKKNCRVPFEHKMIEGGHHCHLEEGSFGSVVEAVNAFLKKLDEELIVSKI